jgi:nucleoside 2-deoxyribosyltransferase
MSTLALTEVVQTGMLVYIAHPCFTDAQREFKNQLILRLKEQLSNTKHGRQISLIDPFDHSPDIEGSVEAKIKFSREVMETCIDLLEKCRVVIVVVDDGDTGDAFEAGYAHRMGIPIILVSKDTCDSANAMLIGSCSARFDDILDDMQISMLVALLEWFYLQRVHNGTEPGMEN